MTATETDTALELAEPLIERYLRSLFHDISEADAEDAAQTARIKVWSALPKFDPARGRLEAFLNRVVENALRDERRRLKTLPTTCELADQDQPVTDADVEAEQLCNQVLADPVAFVGPTKARLLTALLESPDRRAAAAKLKLTIGSMYALTSNLRRELLALLELRSVDPVRSLN